MVILTILQVKMQQGTAKPEGPGVKNGSANQLFGIWGFAVGGYGDFSLRENLNGM